MEKTKIKLYVHFSRKEKFIYDRETYDCGVLFLNVAGSFQYRIGSSPLSVINAGEAVYCPPGHSFQRRVISPVDLHMIKFRGTLPRNEYIINGRIKDDLRAISHVSFMDYPDDNDIVSHYCRDIIYTLLADYFENKTEPVLKYINDNLSQKLTNSVLSKFLHCSEVSLISHIKSLTGKTPQQYINEKRIETAKEFLLSTDKSIALIASQCGFDDPLYFSKVFRKETGMSPSEFKSKFKL